MTHAGLGTRAQEGSAVIGKAFDACALRQRFCLVQYTSLLIVPGYIAAENASHIAQRRKSCRTGQGYAASPEESEYAQDCWGELDSRAIHVNRRAYGSVASSFSCPRGPRLQRPRPCEYDRQCRCCAFTGSHGMIDSKDGELEAYRSHCRRS